MGTTQKLSDDLEFLSSYWLRLNKIKESFKEFTQINHDLKEVEGSKYLKTIQFSQIKNSWNFSLNSSTLIALSHKLMTMIEKGRAIDIEPMIKSITENKIKKLSRKDAFGKSEFLGYGHFRWNWQAYTLTEKEIENLKKFFYS